MLSAASPSPSTVIPIEFPASTNSESSVVAVNVLIAAAPSFTAKEAEIAVPFDGSASESFLITTLAGSPLTSLLTMKCPPINSQSSLTTPKIVVVAALPNPVG